MTKAVESFFIIADEIAQLAGGKMMAMGIYADRVILLHVAPNHSPGGPAPALAKLHLMLTMKGLPSGEHDAHAVIEFPDGALGPKVRPLRVTVLPGLPASVIFGFVPFPMPQEGQYILRLRIADNTIENQFTVRYAQMTPEVAAAAGLPFSVTPPAARKGVASAFKRPAQAGPAAKRAAPAAKKAAKQRR